MKNQKKVSLNLKKIQISKLESSTISGGKAFCTEALATCYPCASEFRSCADLIK